MTLKLSSKKMQFVFKKYLKYEQKHGNAKKQERVKQMAREWVERKESTEEYGRSGVEQCGVWGGGELNRILEKNK